MELTLKDFKGILNEFKERLENGSIETDDEIMMYATFMWRKYTK